MAQPTGISNCQPRFSSQMCFPRGEVGEGEAEVVHSIKNIFNVNAFAWNIFLIHTSVKRHYSIHTFTCLACEAFELEVLVCCKASYLSKVPNLALQGEGGEGGQEFATFEKSSPDDLNTGGLHIGIWYGERYNVTFPFFYNLCEPFSLNVQLLCSVITITTCMLSDVCLINFITGCV